MNIKRLFFSFYGRINRGTYWTIVAVALIVTIVIFPFFHAGGIYFFGQMKTLMQILSFLNLLVMVASIVSIVAACVKRLHDLNQTGAWSLLLFVTIVANALGVGGPIAWTPVLVVLSVGMIPGTKGPNRFGLCPEGWMKIGAAVPLEDTEDEERSAEQEAER